MDWLRVLLQVSEEVRRRVWEAYPAGRELDVDGFKDLLDQVAQMGVEDSLRRLGVDADVVSEEGSLVLGRGGPILVVDPVDGTTNLARGFNPATLSISVATAPRQSAVQAALVANLYTGRSFTAQLGRGAKLGDTPLRVAPPIPLEKAMLGFDTSKSGPGKAEQLLKRSRHTRMEGCCSHSICQVAAGALDAHIDLRGVLRATDVSAGLFILREAGGVYWLNGVDMGDLELAEDSRCSLVAASGPSLLKEIKETMG